LTGEEELRTSVPSFWWKARSSAKRQAGTPSSVDLIFNSVQEGLSRGLSMILDIDQCSVIQIVTPPLRFGSPHWFFGKLKPKKFFYAAH